MLIQQVTSNLGSHFQGTSPKSPNPGLKPRAVLSNHFMVKGRPVGRADPIETISSH
jgi:hypothetical protein